MSENIDLRGGEIPGLADIARFIHRYQPTGGVAYDTKVDVLMLIEKNGFSGRA